jgi:hypothetical protein
MKHSGTGKKTEGTEAAPKRILRALIFAFLRFSLC